MRCTSLTFGSGRRRNSSRRRGDLLWRCVQGGRGRRLLGGGRGLGRGLSLGKRVSGGFELRRRTESRDCEGEGGGYGRTEDKAFRRRKHVKRQRNLIIIFRLLESLQDSCGSNCG